MPSISFTEAFSTITSSPTTGAWTSIDLTSLSVPDSAVVAVLIQYAGTANAALCGVRTYGSSVVRRFDLHEAEAGGVTSCLMHVQADASARIEYYAESASTTFTLLGYYGSGITYTEAMTDISGLAADWRTVDVGIASRVCEVVCVNSTQAAADSSGVRVVGSSLVRHVPIHEAESDDATGVNCYTSYAKSDASSDIQVYRQTSSSSNWLVGYFSSNVNFLEKFDTLSITSANTWTVQSAEAT